MKITQMRVSNTISFFKLDLLNKYNLLDYYCNKKPSFFYGIYTQTDMNILMKHKGMKVIIWSGTDTNYKNNKKVTGYINKIKKLKNVHIISNSQFIADDMDHFDLKHKRLPICGINPNSFRPVVKGNAVYIYTSATKPHIYGHKMYKEIMRLLPQFKFIIATTETSLSTAKKKGLKTALAAYNKKQMLNVYSRCFIGLRLTDHDGISYTVIELGLCGIRCIHNGDQPNAIGYQTVDDIVKAIVAESSKINTINRTIATKTKNWLNIDTAWKDSKYYLK